MTNGKDKKIVDICNSWTNKCNQNKHVTYAHKYKNTGIEKNNCKFVVIITLFCKRKDKSQTSSIYSNIKKYE